MRDGWLLRIPEVANDRDALLKGWLTSQSVPYTTEVGRRYRVGEWIWASLHVNDNVRIPVRTWLVEWQTRRFLVARPPDVVDGRGSLRDVAMPRTLIPEQNECVTGWRRRAPPAGCQGDETRTLGRVRAVLITSVWAHTVLAMQRPRNPRAPLLSSCSPVVRGACANPSSALRIIHTTPILSSSRTPCYSEKWGPKIPHLREDISDFPKLSCAPSGRLGDSTAKVGTRAFGISGSVRGVARDDRRD